jgi:hypothetical protein
MLYAAWTAFRLFAGRTGAAIIERAKDVPWQAWVMLALLVAIPVNGCNQYKRGHEAGKESVLATLRAAEAEADKRALKAIAKAEGAVTPEVVKHEAETQALREAIREAEAVGGNALDAAFK